MVAPLTPLEVHTPLAVKVAGKPLPPPVAVTVNDGAVVNWLLIGLIVTVCDALATLKMIALLSDAPGATPAGLETAAITMKFPAAVGVPDISPVDGLKLRPGGRLVALLTAGKLDPVSV